MTSYALGIVFSLFVFIVIFLSLRNAGMKERYATWWLVIGVVVLIMSVFPNLLGWLSGLLGVILPLNLGVFLGGLVLLLITLQYSVDLSRADEKRRRLVEEIAILDLNVRTLEERLAAVEARETDAPQPKSPALGAMETRGETPDVDEGSEPAPSSIQGR